MDNRDIEILRKNLARVARRYDLSTKQIVIFGASAASLEIIKSLREHGLQPNAVIDNDTRKIGRECMGLRVQKPEDALLPFDASVVILLFSGRYYREITLQLEKFGYEKGRHIFRLNDRMDESLWVTLKCLGYVLLGYLAYRRLSRKYPGHTLLLAPYTGTGDVYLAGLFFREYVKRHEIGNYVFVTVSGACKKVAEAFGVEKIEVIPRLSADYIIKCDRALRLKWPLVILNDSWAEEHTNLLQWIRGYKDLSFDRMFRHFVFDFGDDVEYQLPPPGDNAAQVDALFAKHRLIKGRTVVLSPYSNTLFEIPPDVWKAIVEHCEARGVAVCTNSAGAAEPAIEGTVPVFFPLGIAREFLDAAGWFVGVRSGLCDIISASSCKKIIFYEKDGFFYKCSPFEYFSLKKMGLCNDATELEYRSDLKDEVLRQVLEQLPRTDFAGGERGFQA